MIVTPAPIHPMPGRLGSGELWSRLEGLVVTGGPGRDRRPRIPKNFRLRQIRKPNNQRLTGSGRWVKISLKSQQPGNNHGRWLPWFQLHSLTLRMSKKNTPLVGGEDRSEIGIPRTYPNRRGKATISEWPRPPNAPGIELFTPFWIFYAF
jgi:hypothetical protein